MKTELSISIIASGGTLCVSLLFPAGADEAAIATCMCRVAGALAVVDQLSGKQMQDCLWEQKRLSPTEYCIMLRRAFSDPDYRDKFYGAFRDLNENLSQRWFH